MPTVTHATVTINSITIVDSSVNSTSEPGSNAEWRLTFIVNGQGQLWSRDDVKDNTTFGLAFEFPMVPLDQQGMITIQVSGYEYDPLSANDPLPQLRFTVDPAHNFLLGGTRWSDLASSDEGSYMIEYSIRPAITQPLTVAREFIAAFHLPPPNPWLVGSNIPVVGSRAVNPRLIAQAVARSIAGYSPLWAGPWDTFIAHWQSEAAAGRRLTRLSVFGEDTGIYSFGDTTVRTYLGTFEPASDAYGLWVAPWQTFEPKWSEWSIQGLRLVDVAAYEDDGQTIFAGVFRQGSDGHALWVSDWQTFESKWRELSQANLRLVSIDTFVEAGTRKYVGVYREGTDGYALWAGADWNGFKAKTADLRSQGLHLVDMAAYADGAENRFIGAYRALSGGSQLFSGDLAELQAEISAQRAHNGRIVSVETFTVGDEG
jgi:hypothetical protein